MKRSANNPLALDTYYTRGRNEAYLNKKDSAYAGTVVSYLAVILFVAIDFACLNSSWTSVQNDNVWLVGLISVGCAVALDVPMAIAAIVAKQGYQRLRGRRETALIVGLCVFCFLLVWGFQIGFRMVTRDATFSENASTLINTLDTSASTASTGSGKTVIYAALFSAVLPFCTSIASFIITYFGCDPLAVRIYRKRKVLLQTDAHLIEMEQALSEAGSAKKHMEFLLAHERDRLDAHLMQIRAKGNLLKQVVRNTVMKKLSTPEQVAVVQQSGESLNTNAGDLQAPTAASDYLALSDALDSLGTIKTEVY